MSASRDSFLSDAQPAGAGSGLRDHSEPDIDGELGEKWGRIGRFEPFPIRFSLGPAYGHPRSEPVLAEGSSKPYFLFLSRDFRDEAGEGVFKEEDRITPSNSDHPRTYSSKALTKEHPAFTDSPLPKAGSSLGWFSDVLYAVYFSQIAGALITGSPLVVSRIKRLSRGCYQAKIIKDLRVHIDLSAILIHLRDPLKFIETGALHWILVSQLLRNLDGASSNIGEVGKTKRIALFDFDCFGGIDFSPQSWGFRTLEYVDLAGKIPPVPISKEGYVESFDGPQRWIDRHQIGKREETAAHFHEKHYYYYFETQALWRAVWLHPFGLREKWYLWLKCLTLSDDWLNRMGLGFLGDIACTEKFVSKMRGIRWDVEYSLPLSVLFRLDLLMNSQIYQERLFQEYAQYNEAYFPRRKPKNLKYHLTPDLKIFEALEKQFLSPPLTDGDLSVEWNQNAVCSYLQFLVVLGLPCFSEWREKVPACSFERLQHRLDETHQNKLMFFQFLFNRHICRESSTNQLFFLIQVFQLLYPTLKEVQPVSWYHLPDVKITSEDGEKKGFYFPGQAAWAFSHFSVAELTSPEAHKKFPSKSGLPSEFGSSTTNEAYLNMAELVRMGV
jgi:hypothetical protein